MTRQSQEVNSLIQKNYLCSIGFCFAFFVLLAAMFVFDLEDNIFENQVSVEADKLSQTMPLDGKTSGIVRSLEMQYYVGTDSMPLWLKNQVQADWKAGEYEVFGGEKGHYHLAVRGEDQATRLYLIFNARPYIRSTQQVRNLVIFFVIFTSLMVLVAGVFLRRMTKKLTEPIEKIASAASSGATLDSSLHENHNTPIEIAILAKAIAEKDGRIESLLERERQFNRDVSHELRTPLAVAVGAAEIVQKQDSKSEALQRLVKSLGDMRLLTEGILWLGRSPSDRENCNAKEACHQSVRTNKHLLGDRSVAVEITGKPDTDIPVPSAVAQVIIGNLVRNAFRYTETGSVEVNILDRSVRVRDTGIGYGNASDAEIGFGIGLSLVQRLSSHFGLRLTIAARTEGGTEAMISW